MKNTWEYNREVIRFDVVRELLNKLNILGNDGWEIISYTEIKKEDFCKKFEVTIFAKRLKSV